MSSDYVSEYPERAVVENPGDFDVLLFYPKQLPHDSWDEQSVEKKVAGYCQLLSMNPSSVEVLWAWDILNIPCNSLLICAFTVHLPSFLITEIYDSVKL